MGAPADDGAAYYEDLATLGAQATAAVLRQWRRIRRSAIAASWQALLPEVVAIVVAAQTVAAELAGPYLAERIGGESAGAVNVEAFAGEPQAGGDLAAMFDLPSVDALHDIGLGTSPAGALRQAEQTLAMYTRTLTADAGRDASQVATAAHRHAGGYYRMLRPPSCARCAILAGAFYRWNSGFERHPRCFPAGIVVSGPAASAATRRWYEGELVVLATASGQNLSLTGNHPVLTTRGWVPAHLIEEGDEVVRGTRPEGATPLVIPDHHEVPSFVEDVWGALSVAGLQRMPTAAQDFHGDGQDGHVDVVWAHGALLDGIDTALLQQVEQQQFSFGICGPSLLDGQGAAKLVDLADMAQAGGSVRGCGLPLSIGRGHLPRAYESSLAGPSTPHACRQQSLGDGASGDVILPGEREFTGTVLVGGDDGVNRQVTVGPRWDAPGDPFTVHSREGYARKGLDLLHRLSGQVELDRVVELRRIHWSGHVYSLTSSEGWHVANSLIVSNCDCVNVPVERTTDGLEYDARKAIEAGQVTGLSAEDREAIRLGADPAQVVNARRGMYVDRGFEFTREATTRRGIAGARILARDVARTLEGGPTGRTFRNLTFDRREAAKYAELFRRGKRYVRTGRDGRLQTYSYRFTRTGRLTPRQILRDATSREDAVRLLINNGYII